MTDKTGGLGPSFDKLMGDLGKMREDMGGLFGEKSEPKPDPKPKVKLKLRRKFVDGAAYIHADDVAAILEANEIQPGLIKTLRAMKENP